MGTEAFWIPAAVAAIGAGTQYYSGREAAKDQDRIAAQGIRTQAERQRQADTRVNQELDTFEQSSPDAERQQSMDDFVGQLRASRGRAAGTTGVPGASDRYQADTAASEAGIQNYGRQVADTLSRISAPGRQRQNEAIGVGRLGADIGGVARQSEGEDFLTRLRASGVQRNPWLDAGGQVLQAAGTSMATRAPNGAAVPPKAAATVPTRRAAGEYAAIFGGG